MSGLFNLNRFYDQIAPWYTGAMSLLPVWRRYVEAVLPWLPAGGKVLEIGPGPGWLLAQIAQRHPLAAGVDRSAGMLRQARRHLQRTGCPIRLSRGDATRLPFASQSFDAVTLTFTLSAIPDGLAAMKEMARVLRRPEPARSYPGGSLALVDAGYPTDGNPAGAALAKLWELGGDLMRDETALMEAAGLEVIHRHEFGAFNSIRLVVGRQTALR